MLKLNCGLSYPEQSFEDEIEKIRIAEKYRIDFVSVISVDEDRAISFWEEVAKLKRSFTLCSAPIYESVMFNEDPKDTIKRHASYGVEAMTFHITPKEMLIEAEKSGFMVNSRGGQFIREMKTENPYYSRIRELVDYAHSLGVKTVFLGTSLRPGACESVNTCTMKELMLAISIYDSFVSDDKYSGIDFQIECFGHVPVSEFECYRVLEYRRICTMGPLLTDAVNGYDELNAIIGYTLALQNGFNIATECMLSRSEHIKMPTVEDVEDECQKWRVAELVNGIANRNMNALVEENKVISKKMRQRTQCSAHVNIFGSMDIPEVCNVCGDKCPLLKDKKQLEGNAETEDRKVAGL